MRRLLFTGDSRERRNIVKEVQAALGNDVPFAVLADECDVGRQLFRLGGLSPIDTDDDFRLPTRSPRERPPQIHAEVFAPLGTFGFASPALESLHSRAHVDAAFLARVHLREPVGQFRHIRFLFLRHCHGSSPFKVVSVEKFLPYYLVPRPSSV